jgi:hypothetical protein
MVLLVRHPPSRTPERQYALDVVLREFLGLEYRAIEEKRTDTSIALNDEADGKRLVLPDSLFACADEQWLAHESLPARDVQWMVPRELLDETERLGAELPVLCGRDYTPVAFDPSADQIELPIDLFGGVFALLTRYEEIANPERDPLDRFQSSTSFLGRHGLLERPIANEYVELLWRLLARLWPRLQRRQRSYRAMLTHDVDALSVIELSGREIMRSLGADLLLRRDGALLARRTAAYVLGKASGEPRVYDPYNTYGFIMDISERVGLRSAFNFVAGTSDPLLDPRYDIESRRVRAILRSIAARGHEIGFHPSYGTYLDPARTAAEFTRLTRVCAEEGIQQTHWGGRQHYLRWRNPTTWRNWDQCQLTYDGTLGFADHVGFRTGTCWEYPVFDLVSRRRLALRERPLIAMESSLLNYMRLPISEAAARLVRLSRTCRAHRGDFTLLWHGHMLASRDAKHTYADVVHEAA